MSNYGDHARMVAHDYILENGQTARNQLCPACGGGQSKERTFSVTRAAMGVLYHCYRGKCNVRGFVPEAGFAPAVLKQENTQKLSPYYGEQKALDDSDFVYFADRFGLLSQTCDHNIYVSGCDEYVLPIWTPERTERGTVVRQPVWKSKEGRTAVCPRKGRDKPKSKSHPHTAGPVQSWYFPELAADHYDHFEVVIVEDQLSAMKVAQAGVKCVALLGTDLNLERVREIGQVGGDIILALDEDATANSFKHAQNWGLAFTSCRVALLEQDLKDTDAYDILNVLGLS
jgi:hypothetical protein